MASWSLRRRIILPVLHNYPQPNPHNRKWASKRQSLSLQRYYRYITITDGVWGREKNDLIRNNEFDFFTIMWFDLWWVFPHSQHLQTQSICIKYALWVRNSAKFIVQLVVLFFLCRCVMTSRQQCTSYTALKNLPTFFSVDFLLGGFFHLLLSDKTWLLAILNANALCVCAMQCHSSNWLLL